MRGEIIILASLGTFAVFAGDYLRKAWHEITQDTPDDDPYGDWPFVGMWESGAAPENQAGGVSELLNGDCPGGYDIAHRNSVNNR